MFEINGYFRSEKISFQSLVQDTDLEKLTKLKTSGHGKTISNPNTQTCHICCTRLLDPTFVLLWKHSFLMLSMGTKYWCYSKQRKTFQCLPTQAKPAPQLLKQPTRITTGGLAENSTVLPWGRHSVKRRSSGTRGKS